MSLVNILVMIIGLGSWDDQCAEKHLDDEYGDLYIGPGMNSYIATFGILFVVTVFHIITPVPSATSPPAEEGGNNEK